MLVLMAVISTFDINAKICITKVYVGPEFSYKMQFNETV